MRELAKASPFNSIAVALSRPEDLLEAMNHEDTITVGRYLISPLTKVLANGWYACSVSIRSCCSCCSSGTHDRVLRLTRLSQNKLAAVRYAIAEGLQWISNGPTAIQGAALAAH